MSLIFSLPLTETFKVKLTAATCSLGCVFQTRGLVILLKSLLLLPLRIGSATVPSMSLAVLAKSIHLIWLCQSQLSRVNLVCATTNVLLIVGSKIVLFKLDYLTHLCRYVDPGHYQTTFDYKSGYDHIRLHPRSSTFFGCQWEGWYFTYACLPFGWKASAFVYNTVGLTATHCIRSLGVPCSQYIDDRHVGQLRLRPRANDMCAFSNFQLAQMAAFIACSVVLSLGYFIGLKKSLFDSFDG